MNSQSIKFRLIATFLGIGIAFFMFIILVVPPKTKTTAENVMKDDVEFIVKLLTDNLSLGMLTRELDDGAALEQTLNILRGETISSVVVLDNNLQFVKGLKSESAKFNQDTIVNTKNELIVFATMNDSEGKKQGYVEIVFSKSKFISNINSFILYIWITSVIVLIVVVVLGTSLSNRITSPLKKSIGMLKNISSGEGDLTMRLPVNTKDEVGEQSELFNNFIKKLQLLMKDITVNASGLNQVSTELTDVASNTSGLADSMKSKSTNTSLVMDKVVSSLHQISSSSKDMALSVESVTSSIEEMSSSVNEVTKNCQAESVIALKANEEAIQAVEKMNQLGDSAKNIGKIVEVIQDISDQINLLALNATIEAASAGNAGKGFTVVAHEVKELAKQTAQATDSINTQINEMRTNTEQSINAIDKIRGIIEEVNTISQTIVTAVEEQSVTANAIAGNVGQANNLVRNIASSVEKSVSEIVNVSSNIQDVKTAADATQDGVNKNMTSVSRLSVVINKLTEIVGQFKV